MKKHKYTFRILARPINSLGKRELFIDVIRYGNTFEEARIALYNEYEHITVTLAKRSDAPRPLKRRKYEAFPTARFWIFHRGSYVKLSLRPSPKCPHCGGCMNQRIFAWKPLNSVCIRCERVTPVAFQDRLRVAYGEQNDEGYSFEDNTYSYQTRSGSPVVFCEWANGGRDCDGLIRRSGTVACGVDNLKAKECYNDGFSFAHLFRGEHIRIPEWKKMGRDMVHDAYAAAAGY